jgi:hypothetical protein
MTLKRLAFALSILFVSSSVSGRQANSQSANPVTVSPSRDPQALLNLAQSITAMGGSAPSDATLTGTVSITAGSSTETGTFTLLTKGINQTSETIATQTTNRTLISSNDWAANVSGGSVQTLAIEPSLSARSAVFPLPFLLHAIDDASLNIVTLGEEAGGASGLTHLQFWRTIGPKPNQQALSSFTIVDVWLDQVSNLPSRISYTRRDGGGTAPTTTIDVYYSGFKNFGGILCPMTLQESLNGTPWAEITLLTCVFNAGLSDSSFPVQ